MEIKNILNKLGIRGKIFISGLVIIILLITGIFLKSTEYADYTEEFEEETIDDKNNETILEEVIPEIKVYVIGAVMTEGVATLDEGSRIEDAINLAGGLTEDADKNRINLAAFLTDGQMIYVPKISDNTGEVEIIESDIGISNGKININTAGIDELKKLDGIGDSTAQKIIDYRKSNGKFQSIDDLKKISGIGTAKFNNIKDKITV